jgi:hypothetical protein
MNGAKSRKESAAIQGLWRFLAGVLRQQTLFCRHGANLFVGAKREFVGAGILGAKRGFLSGLGRRRKT